MSNNRLGEQTKFEANLSKKLRGEALDIIMKNDWNAQKVAEILGLLPSGVDILIKKNTWPLETSIRVASALGLQLDCSIKKRTCDI